MRRSSAAPALPSLFDDDPPAPVQAAPRPVDAKTAPVKPAPVKPAPKPTAAKAAPAKASPAPKAAAPQPAAVKAAPKPVTKPAAKAVKIIPVKGSAPSPPSPVRVIAETGGPGGRAWKLSGRYAVAYLMDSGLAGELLATEPKHLARAAMAVYYDRKGKAFAWQVRFDAERWDEVVRRLTA